jgi:hypothetical protein
LAEPAAALTPGVHSEDGADEGLRVAQSRSGGVQGMAAASLTSRRPRPDPQRSNCRTARSSRYGGYSRSCGRWSLDCRHRNWHRHWHRPEQRSEVVFFPMWLCHRKRVSTKAIIIMIKIVIVFRGCGCDGNRA